MSAIAHWATTALPASALLMVVLLAVRGAARRWIGPRPAYWLWAVPVIRMLLPPLPADLFNTVSQHPGVVASVLAIGPPVHEILPIADGHAPMMNVALALWLGGAALFLAFHIGRYHRFRRRLLATARPVGHTDGIRTVEAAVEGPLAFGIFHPTIAIPRDFARRYTPREQQLALAHERAHHRRGDLLANWLALGVLALHWWNPIAWAAMRAFRDDQEFAVDGQVLAHADTTTAADYARVLAKAAGLGDRAACNLNARSNLKGRLMMLTHAPLPKHRAMMAGSALSLAAAAIVLATLPVAGQAAPASSAQAVTIGVQPDGSGNYTLIIGGKSAKPGAALPGGATLPAEFTAPAGCDLKPGAKPHAMAIKGAGTTRTYTIMCASARPATVATTLREGLASLKTMRASVATQPASPVFPEAERRHALGAIDTSIHEVETTLARLA